MHSTPHTSSLCPSSASRSIKMKKLEAANSTYTQPICSERDKASKLRSRDEITVLLFANTGAEACLTRASMTYLDEDQPVQVASSTSLSCRVCGSRYEYDRTIRDGVVTINTEAIKSAQSKYLRVSLHKYVHISVADDLFQSICTGGSSFLKAAESFNNSRCQNLEEKVSPAFSGFVSSFKSSKLLPSTLTAVGSAGLRPFLEAKDVEACFFLWAAILRTWRRKQTNFSYPHVSREKEVPLYGLINVLLKDFRTAKLLHASDHACTDCAFISSNSSAPGPSVNDGTPAGSASSQDSTRVVQAIVIDGVTCTTPVCAKKGCCAELSNQRYHRFCLEHFEDHGFCGVISGPGMTERCKSFVEGVRTLADVKPPAAPDHVACPAHSKVENKWRQIEEDKPDFIVRLRAARARGRKRKIESHRLTDPDQSDHCKGDWEAASNSMPSRQIVEDYTVDFRKKFAYVYCVMCRPCGMVVSAKFFADSESPTEIVEFVTETFPDERSMPNVILFDAACKVSKCIYARSGKLQPFQKSFSKTLWLVPPIHQQSHKLTDLFCQKNCRVSSYSSFLSPSMTQRWNGTVCEQLFSWLGRREPSIRSMKKSVAETFFLILLEEHNLYLDAERKARALEFTALLENGL